VARTRARIWIGCSGWNYKAWRGTFYPKTVATTGWLEHYARQFDTVEVNGTFYRLPERETFAAWAAQTPASFLFAVKASRYLTHLKRLRDAAEPLTRLFSRAAALGSQLGPVLYQLPASLRYDLSLLRDFLALLPRTVTRKRYPVRHVMEFRDASWYRDDVFATLEASGVALCLHDKREGPYLDDPRGPFIYIRFHGTSGHYKGSYPSRRLAVWANRIREWSMSGRDVYGYFNNDPGASAPRNAATLLRAIAATPSASAPKSR